MSGYSRKAYRASQSRQTKQTNDAVGGILYLLFAGIFYLFKTIFDSFKTLNKQVLKYMGGRQPLVSCSGL